MVKCRSQRVVRIDHTERETREAQVSGIWRQSKILDHPLKCQLKKWPNISLQNSHTESNGAIIENNCETLLELTKRVNYLVNDVTDTIVDVRTEKAVMNSTMATFAGKLTRPDIFNARILNE